MKGYLNGWLWHSGCLMPQHIYEVNELNFFTLPQQIRCRSLWCHFNLQQIYGRIAWSPSGSICNSLSKHFLYQLQEVCFYIYFNNCAFMTYTISLLHFIISQEGIQANLLKLKQSRISPSHLQLKRSNLSLALPLSIQNLSKK